MDKLSLQQIFPKQEQKSESKREKSPEQIRYERLEKAITDSFNLDDDYLRDERAVIPADCGQLDVVVIGDGKPFWHQVSLKIKKDSEASRQGDSFQLNMLNDNSIQVIANISTQGFFVSVNEAGEVTQAFPADDADASKRKKDSDNLSKSAAEMLVDSVIDEFNQEYEVRQQSPHCLLDRTTVRTS